MQSVPARDLAHDIERRRKMRRGPRAAGGADQERDVQPARAAQALGEIGPHHGVRLRHFSRAQIVGARIDRPHVGADQVRLAREPGVECRIRNAVTELARGGHDAQRL